MQTFTRIATATLVGLGLTVGMTPVFAQGSQNAQQSYQTPQSSTQAANISAGQVQKFAGAENQVQSIRSQWQSKISNANDKKTAMQYRNQANQAMVKAVRNSGLSVQQYNNIAKSAQSNPQLAQRIQQAQ